MKLWDLSTQHCVQTIVAHRAEVWAMDISPDQQCIFTGSNDGDIKIWKVDYEAIADGLQETESGDVCMYCVTRINSYTHYPMIRSAKWFISSLPFPYHFIIVSPKYCFTPLNRTLLYIRMNVRFRYSGSVPRMKSGKNKRDGASGKRRRNGKKKWLS